MSRSEDGPPPGFPQAHCHQPDFDLVEVFTGAGEAVDFTGAVVADDETCFVASALLVCLAVFTLACWEGGQARLGTRLSGTQDAVRDGLARAAEFAVLVIVLPTADRSLPTPATVLQPVMASAAAAMIAIFVIGPSSARLAQ
jgi:hypothetical protein